mmetsp:Transcript_24180/g.64885  ORF Transcript_24180/g.64885 Transcript_24180/m.64885 type:complete len:229 (+) Transcript_24180:655-1341(+)
MVQRQLALLDGGRDARRRERLCLRRARGPPLRALPRPSRARLVGVQRVCGQGGAARGHAARGVRALHRRHAGGDGERRAPGHGVRRGQLPHPAGRWRERCARLPPRVRPARAGHGARAAAARRRLCVRGADRRVEPVHLPLLRHVPAAVPPRAHAQLEADALREERLEQPRPRPQPHAARRVPRVRGAVRGVCRRRRHDLLRLGARALCARPRAVWRDAGVVHARHLP